MNVKCDSIFSNVNKIQFPANVQKLYYKPTSSEFATTSYWGGGGLSWIKKFTLNDESGKNGTICISIFK